MERNLDLVRDLLLELEKTDFNSAVKQLIENGYSEESIGFHCYLIGDAGFAKVLDNTSIEDTLPKAIATHLTWHGYEFLDSIRDRSRWEKAKSALSNIGGGSIDIAWELLKEYMKDQLGI